MTVWRSNVVSNVGKDVGKELTERQQVILMLLAADGSLSAKDLSEKMSEKKMSDRTIERYIKQLQDLGYLRREGGRKEGRWIVIK